MYYRVSLEGYQTICVRSFSFAKGQQALLKVQMTCDVYIFHACALRGRPSAVFFQSSAEVKLA